MSTIPGRAERVGAWNAGPAHQSEREVAVGVDIGGTRLRLGVVDRTGAVLSSRTVSSSTGLSAEENPAHLAGLIEAVLEESGSPRSLLLGIGIGTTGPVDTVTGRIDNPYTLPGWSGVSVLGPLMERFGVPVRIDNDASAAALGEYWLGAGAGSERMVMVTIGTGIGGALVVQGDVYSGANGFHPELGHQLIDPSGPPCYCGVSGCWEQLAAGPAIARAWEEVQRARGSTGIHAAEDLFAAGRAGDGAAQALIGSIGRYLGLGLVNVVAFLAPDLVVLGGGVAQHFDLLEAPMRAVIERLTLSRPPGGTAIRASHLGDTAGILGGAYMAFRT